MNFDVTNKPKGFKRIVMAAGHSMSALNWLAKNEAAFRQELVILFVAILLCIGVDFSLYQKLILLSTALFLLFTEIVNTAIEVIIDRVSLELHPLSKLAKDLGSAAVLIALCILILGWTCCFYLQFFTS
ncbi:diacylglycerol kinase [Catenovulum sp. 2E275]|uniref:diacylglycerol kinase n=1 Tax=Catenovulum sp. 2E275 TaxID=2980497 RepID=UPI0021D082A4|nr:diacylglycerol kinase [Catenovulum sp. 2E275]MCU4675340.1 diacylglycerol kinase [Catenovulum sp. 2E275]